MYKPTNKIHWNRAIHYHENNEIYNLQFWSILITDSVLKPCSDPICKIEYCMNESNYNRWCPQPLNRSWSVGGSIGNNHPQHSLYGLEYSNCIKRCFIIIIKTTFIRFSTDKVHNFSIKTKNCTQKNLTMIKKIKCTTELYNWQYGGTPQK